MPLSHVVHASDTASVPRPQLVTPRRDQTREQLREQIREQPEDLSWAGGLPSGARRDGLGVAMGTVALRIIGRRLPGASWSGRHGIHVGLQEGLKVKQLINADAAEAVFLASLEIPPGTEGGCDFRGPHVHGRLGERFIYLVWGEVDEAGTFAMFRRLKLHLAPLLEQYPAEDLLAAKQIQAVLELTDTRGRPLAASLRPPWVTWRLGWGSR